MLTIARQVRLSVQQFVMANDHLLQLVVANWYFLYVLMFHLKFSLLLFFHFNKLTIARFFFVNIRTESYILFQLLDSKSHKRLLSVSAPTILIFFHSILGDFNKFFLSIPHV